MLNFPPVLWVLYFLLQAWGIKMFPVSIQPLKTPPHTVHMKQIAQVEHHCNCHWIDYPFHLWSVLKKEAKCCEKQAHTRENWINFLKSHVGADHSCGNSCSLCCVTRGFPSSLSQLQASTGSEEWKNKIVPFCFHFEDFHNCHWKRFICNTPPRM